MSKEKMQRFLFLGVLVLVFAIFLISLLFQNPEEAIDPSDKDPDEVDPIDTPTDPVTPSPEVLKSPVSMETFNIIRKFYSLDDETADQELSVIKFGSKYFLSRGISIASSDGKEFNVIASLSGTIKEVTDSDVYGKTIIIDHGNNVQTEYISLSTVTVNVGDEIEQGDVIGKSGMNEYDSGAGNHVHFKISVKGVYYDPEVNIGKTASQIK